LIGEIQPAGVRRINESAWTIIDALAILALLVLCNALAMPLKQARYVVRFVLQDNSPSGMGCVSFKSGK